MAESDKGMAFDPMANVPDDVDFGTGPESTASPGWYKPWMESLGTAREHYRGTSKAYAARGARTMSIPHVVQAANERVQYQNAVGKVGPGYEKVRASYEALFAPPPRPSMEPADEPELELGPAFQNPNPPRSAPLNREPPDQPELELGPAFQNPNPPRSAPLNREPPDETELDLAPISKTMAETRPAPLDLGGGPSPLVDWIGAARKTRGRSGVGGTGGIKAPPIASQVPPEIPEALPAGPGLGMQMAGGAAAGAAGGLHGGMIEGVASGAIGGALVGGPVGAAVGAGVGLLTGLVHDIKTPQGSISDYALGRGSPHEGGGGAIHVHDIIFALNKIAGIRSRL